MEILRIETHGSMNVKFIPSRRLSDWRWFKELGVQQKGDGDQPRQRFDAIPSVRHRDVGQKLEQRKNAQIAANWLSRGA